MCGGEVAHQVREIGSCHLGARVERSSNHLGRGLRCCEVTVGHGTGLGCNRVEELCDFAGFGRFVIEAGRDGDQTSDDRGRQEQSNSNADYTYSWVLIAECLHC